LTDLFKTSFLVTFRPVVISNRHLVGKIDGLIVVKYVHKMNGLEYYNRQKEDWGDKELQDIRTEYEIQEMTISQIADIHHRTPGSISYKLKNLGLTYVLVNKTLTRF
jgi:hypothetical protein